MTTDEKWDLNRKIAWRKENRDWYYAMQDAIEEFGEPQSLLTLLQIDDYIVKNMDRQRDADRPHWTYICESLICCIEGFTPAQYHSLVDMGRERQGDKGQPIGEQGVMGAKGDKGDPGISVNVDQLRSEMYSMLQYEVQTEMQKIVK